MENFYYKSPIGILEITVKGDSLISLKISDKTKNSNNETDFIKNIKLQLDEYFSKKRKTFNIKINPKGTDFQKKVWKELLKIPYGETKSYFEIAENIKHKNAYRAVGNACNKNPIMIVVPCHRVISKSGKLSGFAYEINVKEKLLNIENAIIPK